MKVCNISKIPETSEKAVGCLVIPVVMVYLKELDFGVYYFIQVLLLHTFS